MICVPFITISYFSSPPLLRNIWRWKTYSVNVTQTIYACPSSCSKLISHFKGCFLTLLWHWYHIVLWLQTNGDVYNDLMGEPRPRLLWLWLCKTCPGEYVNSKHFRCKNKLFLQMSLSLKVCVPCGSSDLIISIQCHPSQKVTPWNN